MRVIILLKVDNCVYPVMITSAVILYYVTDLTVFRSKVICHIIINILRCVQVVVTFLGMSSVLNAICVNTKQA